MKQPYTSSFAPSEPQIHKQFQSVKLPQAVEEVIQSERLRFDVLVQPFPVKIQIQLHLLDL